MALAAIVTSASAAVVNPITPTNAIDSGNQTSQAAIVAYLQSTYGVTQLYKAEAPNPATEDFSLASSYNTVFIDEFGTGLSGATITYTGGAIVPATAYMLVKNGAQTPAWYFINLTNLDWNGTETLNLSGFWPGQGEISNVVLMSGEPGRVPDGGTTSVLLGLSLLGLHSASRKFLKS